MGGLPNLGVEDDGMEQTSGVPYSAPHATGPLPREGFLVIAPVEGQTGRLFALTSEVATIGRASTCELQLEQPGVSRTHARIHRTDDEYLIEDLGSTYGTFLNGKRIQGRYALEHGDAIGFGTGIVVRFQLIDDTPPPSASFALGPTKGDWSPSSWKTKTALHMPKYDNPEEVEQVMERLRALPPIVTSWEIERLKALIGEAQDGERFLLQGGDCAETFKDCDATTTTNKLKILLQMSLVLTHATRKPVTRIGRLAGQYAKPRSRPTEVRGDVELPSYLGDLVNRPEFTAAARRADPSLLLAGYYHASATMNFVRALSSGRFSDLRRPEYFDLSIFERQFAAQPDYAGMGQQIGEGLHMLRALGEQRVDELMEFFVSHEGLNLPYEESQTRTVPRRFGHYCLTTHLPWIGERTRDPSGAHVEYFRGVQNPIGIKIGPKAKVEDITDLLRILNPTNERGKILLIARMGVSNVERALPPLLEGITRSRRRVLWMCDPMHGNSTTTKSGIKTRSFNDILQELELTFDAHDNAGTHLGGVHFELTGDDVTECIGGGLSETDLDTRYLTACDPRLNAKQAIEMVFRVARRIGRSSSRRRSSIPPTTP